MNYSRSIGRFLAAFAIAGLVFAPLATPVRAKQPPVMTDMAAMAGDMPCCPEEQNKQNRSDCLDCPLVAMCALKIGQAQPTFEGGVTAPVAVRSVSFVLDDWVADSLGSSPPDHPPRILA